MLNFGNAKNLGHKTSHFNCYGFIMSHISKNYEKIIIRNSTLKHGFFYTSHGILKSYSHNSFHKSSFENWSGNKTEIENVLFVEELF